MGMGLNMNRSNAMNVAFKEAYCGEVASRLGKKAWSFPKRWDCQIGNAVANAELCKATIPSFVKAQFANLPETFCLKIFDSNYPPISVFGGERARRRYRSYVMDQDSKATKAAPMTDASMKETIRREVKTLSIVSGKFDIELLSFGLAAGNISLITIAYLYIHEQITPDQVEYVIEALPVNEHSHAAYLIDRYKKIVPTTKIGL
jgi:hypothetical protein